MATLILTRAEATTVALALSRSARQSGRMGLLLLARAEHILAARAWRAADCPDTALAHEAAAVAVHAAASEAARGQPVLPST